jgi:hypothetical protein
VNLESPCATYRVCLRARAFTGAYSLELDVRSRMHGSTLHPSAKRVIGSMARACARERNRCPPAQLSSAAIGECMPGVKLYAAVLAARQVYAVCRIRLGRRVRGGMRGLGSAAIGKRISCHYARHCARHEHSGVWEAAAALARADLLQKEKLRRGPAKKQVEQLSARHRGVTGAASGCPL